MKKRNLLIISILSILVFSCKKEPKITIGQKIEGDFNGDGNSEFAWLKKIETFEDGSADFLVIFSDTTITNLNPKMIGRKVQLINEGDLNDDYAEEISISYKSNSKVPISHMETQSYQKGNWEVLIPFFSLHPGFDTLSKVKLQNVVSKNGKSIEYYTYGKRFIFDKNNKPLDTIRIKETIKLK